MSPKARKQRSGVVESFEGLAATGRDSKGRFLKGSWVGGPGRPSRKTEYEYLRLLSEACDLEDWWAIILKAVEQAKSGDFRAREWLAGYLLGPPPTAPTPALSNLEDVELFDALAHGELSFSDDNEENLLKG